MNVKSWALCALSAWSAIAARAEAQAPAPTTTTGGIIEIAPSPPPPGSSSAPTVAPEPAPPAAPPVLEEAKPGTKLLIVPPAAEAPTAVAIVPPSPPSAPASPGWSPVYTASFFTRYELRSGYDDLSLSSATSRPRLLEGDAIYYRMRFGIGTGLLDVGNGLKVGVQFTPQATGVFGNLTVTPNNPNTVVDANLGLHEGYTRIQGQRVRFDGGRFEMNYGDSVVIGNLDWNEIGRSFDGVRARISTDPTSAWLDVFATLVDEGRPDITRGQTLDAAPGTGQGDVYFLGAYGAFGPAIQKGLELDGYALVRSWSEDRNVRLNAMSPVFGRERAADATFGLRAKQKIGMLDYRFEGGIQKGSRPGAAPTATTMNPPTFVKNVDARAFSANLELGATVLGGMLRLGVEGIYASGDNAKTKGKSEGWDELFATGHRFLGLSDAFVQNGQKRTNVASGLVHLTLKATEALTFQVDGLLFARPERSPQFNDERGLAAGEIDTGAALMLAKGLKLRALYAIFLPKDAFYNDVLPVKDLAKGADPVHYLEVELRYEITP